MTTEKTAYLECKQQQESFDRVVATVHEVTHEEVVGVGAFTAHLEELHEVLELSVNVSANLHMQNKGVSHSESASGYSQTTPLSTAISVLTLNNARGKVLTVTGDSTT